MVFHSKKKETLTMINNKIFPLQQKLYQPAIHLQKINLEEYLLKIVCFIQLIVHFLNLRRILKANYKIQVKKFKKNKRLNHCSQTVNLGKNNKLIWNF